LAPPHPDRPKYETVYHDPSDDRVQIIDTARIPWRAICHLQITRETGHVTTGTGWFAGPDLVVTAGHNFLHHQEGGVATSIIITAGHDGTADPPYASVTPANAYIHPRWQQDADPSFDYAFLRLADDRLGRRTGYFAFADAPDDLLRGVLVNTAGYPFDKPHATQWYSAGRLYKLAPTRVAYHIDTEGGCSGAPLIYKRGDKRVVLAMHTQGDLTPDRSRYNIGVRITGTFFDELKRATGFS
jgi:V8-like Glu-specific endopeptidase